MKGEICINATCYYNGIKITEENISDIKITREDYIQYIESILDKIRSSHDNELKSS